jgi:hypothetical protein
MLRQAHCPSQSTIHRGVLCDTESNGVRLLADTPFRTAIDAYLRPTAAIAEAPNATSH